MFVVLVQSINLQRARELSMKTTVHTSSSNRRISFNNSRTVARDDASTFGAALRSRRRTTGASAYWSRSVLTGVRREEFGADDIYRRQSRCFFVGSVLVDCLNPILYNSGYCSVLMSEEIEYVLLNKKECFVYNVPPATSANGYKAADWAACIWKGKLQVCAKGDILIVKMMDPNTGGIFAACPVPPTSPIDKVIERTTDSSRYFVLTMSDKTGRKAHLGMGFEDRNDAFDFNATMQDFRRQSEAPREVIKPVVQVASNLALKEGQKISVSLKALKTPPASAGGVIAPSVLPPPPASRSRQAVSQPDSAVTDLLDLGFSSTASAVPTPAAASKPTPPPVVTKSLLDD